MIAENRKLETATEEQKKMLSLRLLLVVLCFFQTLATNQYPNIIVFFADNLGYDDIGAFQEVKGKNSSTGKGTRTPNIDKLAADGLKFTNWNSAAALCSASRASLLTGKYPVRTGVFPGVFKPDAENGLSPDEVTIAEYVKEKDYRTKIIGKWHLGHREGMFLNVMYLSLDFILKKSLIRRYHVLLFEEFLPTSHSFDEWFGIPYHMSGGSIDEHLCGFDPSGKIWLPLFNGTKIIEQPVDLTNLAQKYVEQAKEFISREEDKPFFLYFPFSHVHQLCAPQQSSCQWASTRFSELSPNATFADAVEEMDWILGEITNHLDANNLASETLVIFTSDNGPWIAEQSCSGSKGPFKAEWFLQHTSKDCTACPHDYVSAPTEERPRRCIFNSDSMGLWEIDGVACGEDVGLGSCWEANNIMPSIGKYCIHGKKKQ